MECRTGAQARTVRAIVERIRVASGDGGAPRAIFAELRTTPRTCAESTDQVGCPAARSRSCLSKRTSLDGSGTVHVVSGNRSQSAKICPEHLQSESGGFR